MTGAELTDEIREIVGRPGAAASGVITDARVTRWLNDAQAAIVEGCVGLHGMSFKNTTSLDTTATLKYALADITVGDVSVSDAVCRIYDVWYLNGLETKKLNFLTTDEFDELYPDPTHSDIPLTMPSVWTRRGAYIEIMPIGVTAYYDKDLRFDGDRYARDLTTNDATVSDITGADEGLIAYGAWKAWGAIGGPKATLEELKWKRNWDNWLDDFRSQNDDLDEWDGKMFGDI